MREIENTENIILSELNEVEQKEYKILSEAADSEIDEVSPYGVLHKLDRIEFLNRIKYYVHKFPRLMEERPGDF